MDTRQLIIFNCGEYLIVVSIYMIVKRDVAPTQPISLSVSTYAHDVHPYAHVHTGAVF